MAAKHAFGVRWVGVEKLELLLKGIERRNQDMRKAFRVIDKSVSQMFRRQWASKGSVGGTPWAALRPSTRSWRLRRGGNKGGVNHPLWDTGRGKASLEKVGPNSFRQITRTTYERGSTLPYLALHQTGFTVRRWGSRSFTRKVPARPPVPDPIPSYTVQAWATILEMHIAGPPTTSSKSA